MTQRNVLVFVEYGQLLNKSFMAPLRNLLQNCAVQVKLRRIPRLIVTLIMRVCGLKLTVGFAKTN